MLSLLNDTIECDCNSCVSACKYKPGWFIFEEIKPAADFLGLSEQEFFNKYLVIDYFVSEKNKFVLSPATNKSELGEVMPNDPKGQCVFFKEGKCSIHAVKPYECKSYDHRKNKLSQKELTDHHEAVADTWKTHQDYIVSLYGKEPVLPEFNWTDLFSMFS